MIRDDIKTLLQKQQNTTKLIEDATEHMLAVLDGESLDANHIRKLIEDYRNTTTSVRNEAFMLLSRFLLVCQNHKKD